MSPPSISVVLPVYNGQAFLGAAIASVLAQDADLELIISDDGSSDSTLEIARAISDPRVRVLSHADNQGIFGNLNRAIAASSAPLVQVFSQDDLMAPGFLRSQAQVLSCHSAAGLVYDAPDYIDAEGRPIAERAIDATPEVIDPATYLWLSAHYGALPASISSIMITRAALDDVGLFDPSFKVAGDLEFYNRLSERHGLVRNLARLHQVRSHGRAASAVSSAGPAYLDEEIRLAAWYRQRLPPADYAKVIGFRCATRGRYHLGWIARRFRSGQVGVALSGLWRMNRLYPLTKTLPAMVGGPPAPTLAPPPLQT